VAKLCSWHIAIPVLKSNLNLHTFRNMPFQKCKTRQPFYPLTPLSLSMILVYSLGGSILAGRDVQSLREYADALRQLAAEHQIFVVVSGGRIAREYIEKARALGASEMFCDTIGIIATKLTSFS